MMPRYIRQRDNYSCGPVALMNAIKWTGVTKTTSYAMLPSWRLICRTRKVEGTSFSDLFRAVKIARLFAPLFVKKAKPKVKLGDIDAHLKHGGAVILGSVSEPMGGFHWFLITEKLNQAGEASYKVVNFDRRATQRFVSVKTIKRSMRLARSLKGYPRALFIKGAA